MKFGIFVIFFVISSLSWGEVGRIKKLKGEGAYIIRANKKIPLTLELSLEEGDHLNSDNALILLLLYPEIQLSLGKKTEIEITSHRIEGEVSKKRVTSNVGLTRGMIRNKIMSKNGDVEYKVQTRLTSFAVRGTEFEVSFINDNEVELDVKNGVVEASSPFVQSFVPEYVKANEGLKFTQKDKKFIRKNFSPKLSHYLDFLTRKAVLESWNKRKK